MLEKLLNNKLYKISWLYKLCIISYFIFLIYTQNNFCLANKQSYMENNTVKENNLEIIDDIISKITNYKQITENEVDKISEEIQKLSDIKEIIVYEKKIYVNLDWIIDNWMKIKREKKLESKNNLYKEFTNTLKRYFDDIKNPYSPRFSKEQIIQAYKNALQNIENAGYVYTKYRNLFETNNAESKLLVNNNKLYCSKDDLSKFQSDKSSNISKEISNQSNNQNLNNDEKKTNNEVSNSHSSLKEKVKREDKKENNKYFFEKLYKKLESLVNKYLDFLISKKAFLIIFACLFTIFIFRKSKLEFIIRNFISLEKMIMYRNFSNIAKVSNLDIEEDPIILYKEAQKLANDQKYDIALSIITKACILCLSKCTKNEIRNSHTNREIDGKVKLEHKSLQQIIGDLLIESEKFLYGNITPTKEIFTNYKIIFEKLIKFAQKYD